ncbi:MAG: hypothetical protein U5L96_20740, partial [Owenweeksia sp.]|nr:hypothetical protein [Owenweeksia sp.]
RSAYHLAVLYELGCTRWVVSYEFFQATPSGRCAEYSNSSRPISNASSCSSPKNQMIDRPGGCEVFIYQ